MIDYSTLAPIPHMFAMRLLLGGMQQGLMLKIKAANDCELWVDFRSGEQNEERLSQLAKKCGLTELENHHYKIPT